MWHHLVDEWCCNWTRIKIKSVGYDNCYKGTHSSIINYLDIDRSTWLIAVTLWYCKQYRFVTVHAHMYLYIHMYVCVYIYIYI